MICKAWGSFHGHTSLAALSDLLWVETSLVSLKNLFICTFHQVFEYSTLKINDYQLSSSSLQQLQITVPKYWRVCVPQRFLSFDILSIYCFFTISTKSLNPLSLGIGIWLGWDCKSEQEEQETRISKSGWCSRRVVSVRMTRQRGLKQCWAKMSTCSLALCFFPLSC